MGCSQSPAAKCSATSEQSRTVPGPRGRRFGPEARAFFPPAPTSLSLKKDSHALHPPPAFPCAGPVRLRLFGKKREIGRRRPHRVREGDQAVGAELRPFVEREPEGDGWKRGAAPGAAGSASVAPSGRQQARLRAAD